MSDHTPTELRRRLHDVAETSGQEQETARILQEFLASHDLEVQTGIGGHGLLVLLGHPPYRLLRADLDALPVGAGAAHHCGHDGHMAMLAGALVDMQPKRGIAALFQPSEEDGAGMARCLQDSRLAELDISDAFAIHNIPGAPAGQVIVGPGALASTGLRITLHGSPAHAASPESGRNPYPELRHMADAVADLAANLPGAQATLIHVRLGQEAYGTSPGSGVVAATLRGSDEHVATMRDRWLRFLPTDIDADIEAVDPFPATNNTEPGNDAVRGAAHAAGLTSTTRRAPFSWSEDFGHAVARWGGALVGLGAGPVAELHDESYEFPDSLLDAGIRFWRALA